MIGGPGVAVEFATQLSQRHEHQLDTEIGVVKQREFVGTVSVDCSLANEIIHPREVPTSPVKPKREPAKEGAVHDLDRVGLGEPSRHPAMREGTSYDVS